MYLFALYTKHVKDRLLSTGFNIHDQSHTQINILSYLCLRLKTFEKLNGGHSAVATI